MSSTATGRTSGRSSPSTKPTSILPRSTRSSISTRKTRPIHTHKRNLPASKLNYCSINLALTAEGCIITNASITRSIIGIRTVIETGASLDGVVCMGADYYESPGDKAANRRGRQTDVGIAQRTIVKGAIIDKNAQDRRELPDRHRPDASSGRRFLELLYSRRDHHHPEERHHPLGLGDLAAGAILRRA